MWLVLWHLQRVEDHMFQLTNKIAVVTGGETGIGYGIAELFAKLGATVVLAGILDDLGEESVAKLRSAGHKAEFIKLDVRESAAVDAVIDGVVATHGSIDILVNNAGITDGRANLLQSTDELLDLVLDVNLRGAVSVSRAAMRHMVERKYGRIINVASIAALRVEINGLPYTMSKFGMIGLTRHTAVHFGESGVTVNAICPGFTNTKMIDNSKRIMGDFALINNSVGASPDAFKQYVPAKRRGTIEEIAACAAFFASDEASYVTGQVVAADGGLTAS